MFPVKSNKRGNDFLQNKYGAVWISYLLCKFCMILMSADARSHVGDNRVVFADRVAALVLNWLYLNLQMVFFK